MSGARLFGKLPAHGDFVARGLSAAERDRLDAWLSREMVAARERLGEAFEDRYDRAPPWRFTLPDRSGVLVASVDGVGRRFPLWLAVEGGDAEAAEQAEDLVYRAFGEGWTADRLADAADALGSTSGERGGARWWTLGGHGFAAASLGTEQPEGLIATMLMAEVNA